LITFSRQSSAALLKISPLKKWKVGLIESAHARGMPIFRHGGPGFGNKAIFPEKWTMSTFCFRKAPEVSINIQRQCQQEGDYRSFGRCPYRQTISITHIVADIWYDMRNYHIQLLLQESAASERWQPDLDDWVSIPVIDNLGQQECFATRIDFGWKSKNVDR
jgi:hypothetical protein